MTFLLLSMALVAFTLWVVQPAMGGGPGLRLAHVNGIGVLSVFAATLALALFFGLEFALSLLAVWLLKELGHVLGYRMAGHTDARLQLLPLPGGPTASATAPKSDLAAFFVLMMGPVLCLAPMVAAFALGQALAGPAPAIAHAARSFALAAGALNFVALLPLWPLPGGELTRLIVAARFPRVSGLSAAALAAFTIGLSLTWHSSLLFLLGLVAGLALTVRPPADTPRPRLTAAQTRIGFTAYFATLSAFFLGGWWVLRLLPFGI
jgi:hypothetical protein